MAPWQLCNNLLHNCAVGPCLSKGSHVLKVSGGQPGHLRKSTPQVFSQAVNDFRAPSFTLLPGKNIASDVPVEEDQLAVHRKTGAMPGLSILPLEVVDER